MFETSRGVTDENQNKIYLRPETAQGEFVNFLNVQRTTRAKVPFGIAQIGKAFRNEITPGNFIFRTIEFEQMEHQWFCKEGTDAEFYAEYKKRAMQFLLDLGFKQERLRFHDHDKLAHYAKAACDIQYDYPMGWSELNGIHNRTDYDLSRHQEYSGKTMTYVDPMNGERYIPYVIEYSIGADRLMLAVLAEAYDEETLENGEVRNVMHFHPAIAAYKAAVLPLQKNLARYLRRSGLHRKALPPSGRNRNPLLPYRRLSNGGGRHRYRTRPRQHGTNPPDRRAGHCLPRRKDGVLKKYCKSPSIEGLFILIICGKRIFFL